jgi:hypothetical protein
VKFALRVVVIDQQRKPGRHEGSKAMCSAMVLKRNRLCRAARPAPGRPTQSGLSVCHSQIALSLWKSEHPHPARPTMLVTTDPWHASHCGHGLDEGVKALAAKPFPLKPSRLGVADAVGRSGPAAWMLDNLTLVVRSTTARSECERQVSFRKPCVFWDMPHAGTAAAVLTGEFSECLSSTGCCRSVRRPRVGYRAHADELAGLPPRWRSCLPVIVGARCVGPSTSRASI